MLVYQLLLSAVSLPHQPVLSPLPGSLVTKLYHSQIPLQSWGTSSSITVGRNEGLPLQLILEMVTFQLGGHRHLMMVESQSWPHSPLPGSLYLSIHHIPYPSSSFLPSLPLPFLQPSPLLSSGSGSVPHLLLWRNHIYHDWIPPLYGTCWTIMWPSCDNVMSKW